MGIFLDFVGLTTRAPHGGASYVRRVKRNRIDRRSRIISPPPFSGNCDATRRTCDRCFGHCGCNNHCTASSCKTGCTCNEGRGQNYGDCSPCPNGWYAGNGGKGQNCVKSPCGYYTNAGTGNRFQYACPAGKHNPSTGQGNGGAACRDAPNGWYATGTAWCNPKACPAGQYNHGTRNTGCPNCPAGHRQSRTGQGTDAPFPFCEESCAWSNLYAFPATYCRIKSDGKRDYKCEPPFSGTHCEVVGHDPAVLAVKARFYSTANTRDFKQQDFANTEHTSETRPYKSKTGARLQSVAEDGVMVGDGKCKDSMPHGAGCTATAPRMFTNYKKLQIEVEWGHGYSAKPFVTHVDAPTKGAVTQSGRVVSRAANGNKADSLVTSYDVGIVSATVDMGTGGPTYDWSKASVASGRHAPTKNNAHESFVMGMKATFKPGSGSGQTRESDCRRFDITRSIPPPWGSIRFRLAPRTYAPWGVRVVSQTKSRKIPTRNILPLFFVTTRFDITLAIANGGRVNMNWYSSRSSDKTDARTGYSTVVLFPSSPPFRFHLIVIVSFLIPRHNTNSTVVLAKTSGGGMKIGCGRFS